MKKLSTITILIIALVLSGCATTPRGTDISFTRATTYIKGTKYIPATVIMQSYGIQHDWDPITRNLLLEKRGKKAEFCVGVNVAMVGNNIHRMPAATRMYSGEVMIPASFADTVLKDLFGPSITHAKREIKPYARRYAMRTVVIDPGHGGKDPGAISASGIKEKYVNLAIARKLEPYLRGNGINVILTRNRDKFISLWRRSHIANMNNADFFISIHANSARSKRANGIEIYYLSEAVDDIARATAAAENAVLKYENASFDTKKDKSDVEATLWDMLYTENRAESIELAKSISRGMAQTLNARDRGVRSAKFYVLKGANMPSVLIETGFLSNRNEAIKLNDSVYQEQIAQAISDGILLYKRKYEESDGFTQ